MDNSEKLDKTSLPEIEDFYSYLIMEEISNTYYFHTKRLGKDFEKKKEIEGWVNILIFIFKAINYCCYLMYLKTFKMCLLKYMTLTRLIFFPHQD